MHTDYWKLFLSLVLALLWAPPDTDFYLRPFRQGKHPSFPHLVLDFSHPHFNLVHSSFLCMVAKPPDDSGEEIVIQPLTPQRLDSKAELLL